MLGQAGPLAASRTGLPVAEEAKGLAGAWQTSRGYCRPLGATVWATGINFAVF